MKIMDFMDLVLIYGEKLLQLLSICFWFSHDLHDSFRNNDSFYSILANLVVAKESGTRLVACKLKKLTPFNQKKIKVLSLHFEKIKNLFKMFYFALYKSKRKIKTFFKVLSFSSYIFEKN